MTVHVLGCMYEYASLTCALEHADDLAAVRHGDVADEAGGELGAHAQLLVARLQEEVGRVGEEEEDAARRRRRVRCQSHTVTRRQLKDWTLK